MPPLPVEPLPVEKDSPRGTEAARAFFSRPEAPRPLTAWGSSSMASGLGDQGTPLTVNIVDRLALSLAPAKVTNLAVGATLSSHTLLQRGLRTPRVSPARTATGKVTISMSEAFPPCPMPAIPADIDGVQGRLSSTWDSFSFTPDDPDATTPQGILTSHVGRETRSGRHLLWAGKNNILRPQEVIDHNQELWEDTEDPENDTIVLGQWPTPSDPKGSEKGEALATVNAEQSSRYGDHFLDLAAALTDPDALSRGPVAPLRLMEQSGTHDALEAGIAPPDLVGRDDVHLNGWGNLFVLDLLIQRMKEVGWL